MMATVRLGEDKVFIFSDSWLYNEYIDGCKILVVFESFCMGKSLVAWLLDK